METADACVVGYPLCEITPTLVGLYIMHHMMAAQTSSGVQLPNPLHTSPVDGTGADGAHRPIAASLDLLVVVRGEDSG